VEVNDGSIVSRRIPYVPIIVEIPELSIRLSVEALVDTGFTSEVVLPADSVTAQASVREWLTLELADGSRVTTPTYIGLVRIGDRSVDPVRVFMLGDEPIIGLGVITQFRVVIDHDESISFSP
jgi:predicted aspartyl protease